MAKDPRRFVSFTLTEEQAAKIEDEFGEAANKSEAVKRIIDRDRPTAPPPVDSSAQAAGRGCSGVAACAKTIEAKLDLLIQAHIASHPQQRETRDFTAAQRARWIDFERKLKAWMARSAP